MLANLLSRSCLIVRRLASLATDTYGNEIPNEDFVTTVCELQQQQRQETGTEGEVSSALWLLFLPVDTEITTADVVEVEGERYELVGEPWKVFNPRLGEHSHVEATVRRTAGAEEVS